MKKIICLILLAALVLGCQKEKQHMAIDFGNSGTNKYLSYAASTSIDNLSSKTIMFWMYINANPTGGGYYTLMDKGFFAGAGWASEFYNTGGAYVNRLNFVQGFSSSIGAWYIPSSAISTGAWHLVTITYIKTATTNDPIIYLDGVSQTVTEVSTPAGTVDDDTGKTFYIGNRSTADKTAWVKFASLLIYNRILSAAEIADAYNSRQAIPNWNGLVFAPNLSAAAGLTTFDGATLSASNTIPDQVTGALGVPSGSPLAVADTYLEYK